MKASPRKSIRSVLAASVAVMALAGLACGTAATPTPSAKSTPGPIATPAPAATVAPVPAATLKPTPVSRGEEKTLRVGIHSLNLPPDPAKGGWQPVRTGLAETLFKLSKDLRPEPWLANGARQLDEKTWDITLRQGVKFHNGALMDAAAVKASLERAIAKSPTARTFLDIARIEVKDQFTLMVVTNNLSPNLPGMLSEPSSAIVDAAAAEAMGDAFTDKAVLTGPFQVERFQLDKELVAVRHREYWGSQPPVDRLIVTNLADNNSRVLALQSGDIDIAVGIPDESVATVKSATNLTVRSSVPTNFARITLNLRRDPWKDVKVRQAIALAIDREALLKGVTQGQGTAAIGPFPPAMLSCSQLQGHPFDPAKASQLLTQAGYQDKDGDGYVEKDGRTPTMTLVFGRGSPAADSSMAEAIQASLKTIGVKVNVRMAEQLIAELKRGDWDGGLQNSNAVVTGDPWWNLSQWFTTGGAGNHGGFSSPRIDELVQQVGRATDRQARDSLACAASQAVVDELPVIPLLYPTWHYGVSKKVVGFDEPHPFFLYIIDNKIGKR